MPLTPRTVDSPRWYALYLRSRQEKVVEQRLREKGVETLLPMIQEVRQYTDRRQVVIEPLFRGYLFGRFSLRDKMTILETNGIVHIVSAGAKPSPIPDSEMEWVRAASKAPHRVKRQAFLRFGERVRIVEGEFSGIEGYVLKKKGATRVVVSIGSIAQSLAIDVAPDAIRRLPPNQGINEPV